MLKLHLIDLLPREAMLSAVFAVIVRLCVCVSVQSQESCGHDPYRPRRAKGQGQRSLRSKVRVETRNIRTDGHRTSRGLTWSVKIVREKSGKFTAIKGLLAVKAQRHETA